MTDNVEIFDTELKPYVSSSRAATFSTKGVQLRAKTGRAEFDFSRYNPDKVFVHAKRVSGNGKVNITDHNLVVTSRTYQTFDIEVSGGKIEIARPRNSTGDIVIIGFTFLAGDTGKEVTVNWKKIIKKCGKTNCLRLVGGRLYASTGAFIEKGNMIEVVATNPPNCSYKDGPRLRFTKSCEITNIILKSKAASVPAKDELYVNRKPPTPINTPQPEKAEDKTKQLSGNAAMIPQKYQHQLPNFDDNILYDSSSLRNFNTFTGARKGGAKQIKSNNIAYLVMKQGDQSRASLSVLKANTDYICIINAKRLNGNGRLFIGMSIDDKFAGQASEAVFGSSFANKYIKVRTSGGAPNASQKIHLSMPKQFSHGEILIQRIMIIENLGLEHAKSAIEGRKYLSFNGVTSSNNLKSSFGHGVAVNKKDDPVYASSKKYAFYPHIAGVPDVENKLSGTMTSNTVSGVIWMSKIKSVVSNLKIDRPNSELVAKSLLISRLGNLRPARRLFIEPFDYYANITDLDVKAIKHSCKVLSPSLSNIQLLRDRFEGINIEQAMLPLPWVQPTPEPMFKSKEFVLTFERDRGRLDVLLKLWNKNMPPLVVVGARGRYPDYVIPFNEYYPYKKLLFLMKKAKFIVDITNHNDYQSSFQHLADQMGKTIVTNNWFMMGKDNGCIIVPQDGEITKESLALAIEDANKNASTFKNMSKHNDKFLAKLQVLFSL